MAATASIKMHLLFACCLVVGMIWISSTAVVDEIMRVRQLHQQQGIRKKYASINKSLSLAQFPTERHVDDLDINSKIISNNFTVGKTIGHNTPLPSNTNDTEHREKGGTVVVVGIITGSGSQNHRVNLLWPILFQNLPPHVSVLYVTDSGVGMPAALGSANSLLLLAPECGDGQQIPMVCKLAKMIKHVDSEFRDRLGWLLRVTDDTYVNVGNLVRLLASPNMTSMQHESVYGGDLYEWGGHRYMDGGAGWLMSGHLIRSIAPVLDVDFMQGIVQERSMTADDVAFGHYMTDVVKNVQVHHLEGFFNEFLEFGENGHLYVRQVHDFHAHATTVDNNDVRVYCKVVAYHLRIGNQAGGGQAPSEQNTGIQFIQRLHDLQEEGSDKKIKGCSIHPLVLFGSSSQNVSSCDASLLRIVEVHAPNCNDGCGGVRYSNPLGKYDVEIFTDQTFHTAPSSTTRQCKLALLWEPPAISAHMYDANAYDPSIFDAVFTTSEQMMLSNPAFFLRYLPPDSWVGQFPAPYPDASLIPGKTLGISMILSGKRFAPGHKMRHEVWESLLSKKGLPKVDACGNGAGRRVANKTECLAAYRFSIIIENDKDQGYYFSEKLVDCFLTATVPVIWGTGAKIAEMFDARGMIFWQTPADLEQILAGRLDTPQKQDAEYAAMLDSVRCNYERARPLARMIFDRMADYLLESYCHICKKPAF